MDYRLSSQYYYRMCKAFYEYREIGITGLLLTFDDVYTAIGEGLCRSHKKADNDA